MLLTLLETRPGHALICFYLSTCFLITNIGLHVYVHISQASSSVITHESVLTALNIQFQLFFHTVTLHHLGHSDLVFVTHNQFAFYNETYDIRCV